MKLPCIKKHGKLHQPRPPAHPSNIPSDEVVVERLPCSLSSKINAALGKYQLHIDKHHVRCIPELIWLHSWHQIDNKLTS